MDFDFDMVVIGGGAGGIFAASVANTLGANTCLIDKERLGGDCTWFGCMPSKSLLKSAYVANLFRKAQRFGLALNPGFSLNADNVMSHVRDIVGEISTHHPPEVFEKKGIKVIFGELQFIDRETIEINGERLRSKKFIISTGSHPVVLPIEGLKDVDYLTNENIFALERLPQSLIVLGGGPIGVELSQALSRLGVKVSIVEMMEKILFREDNDASRILGKVLREEGLNLLTGKKAVKFQKKEGKVYATLEDKHGKREELSAEKVLVAIGRAANLEGLALEKAGVEYTKKGIKANSFLQTTNRNIFACGDVVGPYMFSHVAAYQASIAVRNALFRKIAWQKVNYANIAWATFTEPEVAHLGITEDEAKAEGKNIRIYKTDYSNSDRAVTDLEKDGLLKVITDKKGFILGAHAVGAQASELIQGLLIAKSLKQPLSKIGPVLFIYPTLSELVKKTAAKPLVEKLDNPFVKFIIKLMKKI